MISDSTSEEARPSPLILHSVTIRRFRSLFNVGPLPVQQALTVLTGENDGGKTTCLDAIAFLLTTQAIDPHDLSHWAVDGEAIEVEGLFYELHDTMRSSPVQVKASQEPGSSRTCLMLGRAHILFGSQHANTSLIPLKGQMKEAGIPFPSGSAKPPFVEAVDNWLMDRPDEEWQDCWSPIQRGLLDRLPRFTRFSAAEAQSPTRTIQKVVAREADLTIKQDGYADPLEGLGQKLGQDIAPSVSRMTEMIRQHSPALDDVKISASFDFSKPVSQVHVEVCRHGEWSDLEKGGEGRRRRVTLAVHEATAISMEGENPSRTDVIVYDEPDTHLDFNAQRTLFDVLDRQASLGHVQVLVATHSKNFIDMVGMETILHFRLGTDQRTRVETLSAPGHEAELSFQAEICESLGLRNSMLLDERCFIVVEGETEDAAIKILFPLVTGRTLVSSGIHIINTRGNGKIRSFVETLKLVLHRDVVVLADLESADEQKKQRRDSWLAQLGLKEGTEAYFIGPKEFEDAFSDATWLSALNASFEPASGEKTWSVEDLTELRLKPKFSQALHSEVCRRCKDSSIGKPDLGQALARACTCPDDVPQLLRECFIFAQTMAVQNRQSR